MTATVTDPDIFADKRALDTLRAVFNLIGRYLPPDSGVTQEETLAAIAELMRLRHPEEPTPSPHPLKSMETVRLITLRLREEGRGAATAHEALGAIIALVEIRHRDTLGAWFTFEYR